MVDRKKVGRKPIGKVAMTSTEKTRRYRAKQKELGKNRLYASLKGTSIEKLDIVVKAYPEIKSREQILQWLMGRVINAIHARTKRQCNAMGLDLDDTNKQANRAEGMSVLHEFMKESLDRHLCNFVVEIPEELFSEELSK